MWLIIHSLRHDKDNFLNLIRKFRGNIARKFLNLARGTNHRGKRVILDKNISPVVLDTEQVETKDKKQSNELISNLPDDPIFDVSRLSQNSIIPSGVRGG